MTGSIFETGSNKDVLALGAANAYMALAAADTKTFTKHLRKAVGRGKASRVAALPDYPVYIGALAALVAYLPLIDQVQETLDCEMGSTGAHIVFAAINRNWPDRMDIAVNAYETAAGVIPRDDRGSNPAGDLMKASRLFLNSCFTGIDDDLEILLSASGWLFNMIGAFGVGAEALRPAFWHPGVKPEG